MGENKVEINTTSNTIDIYHQNVSTPTRQIPLETKVDKGNTIYTDDLAAKFTLIQAESGKSVVTPYESAIIGASLENRLTLGAWSDESAKIYGEGTYQSLINAKDQYQAAQYPAYKQFPTFGLNKFSKHFDSSNKSEAAENKLRAKMQLTSIYTVLEGSVNYLESTGMLNAHLIYYYAHGSDNSGGKSTVNLGYDKSLAPNTTFVQSSKYEIKKLWNIYMQANPNEFSK